MIFVKLNMLFEPNSFQDYSSFECATGTLDLAFTANSTRFQVWELQAALFSLAS